MLPQRKIAHKIADIVMYNAKRNLSESRMRDIFINSSNSMPIVEGIDDDQTKVIVDMWIDSIVEHVSSKQDSLTSDYILNLIDKIQNYLEKNYSSEDLNKIASFFNEDACKRVWSDNNMLEIIASCKDEMNNSVMALMQSEECMDIMQKKLSSFMMHGRYDDNYNGAD
jgi:hypothetical protein